MPKRVSWRVVGLAACLGVLLLAISRPIAAGRPASAVPASARAGHSASVSAQAGYSASRRGSGRAACSAREPFAPPRVATLPTAGLLALDARRGLAIVVSSMADARGTHVTVDEYDVKTGRAVRSGRIDAAPLVRTVGSRILSDLASVAVDGTTGRIFLLHAPYLSGLSPAGRVDVLDARALTLLHTERVGGLAQPPLVDETTGRVFIASQAGGNISVLDATTGRRVRTVALSRVPLGPSAAPILDERTGRVFFAEDTARGRVDARDARDGAIVRRIAVGPFPQTLAVDRANGHVLVASGTGGGVDVLDARDGTLLHAAPLPGPSSGLTVAETTHRAFVSYADRDTVSMLDTATGTLLRTVPVRRDYDLLRRRRHAREQADGAAYPVVARVDETMRWVVVRAPEISDDEGIEPGSAQLTVLDTRTATRVHTIITGDTWPEAAAIDTRRGRAFVAAAGGMAVYDVSCLTSYYVFGDLG